MLHIILITTTIPPEIIWILACDPKGHNSMQYLQKEQTETMQLTRRKWAVHEFLG